MLPEQVELDGFSASRALAGPLRRRVRMLSAGHGTALGRALALGFVLQAQAQRPDSCDTPACLESIPTPEPPLNRSALVRILENTMLKYAIIFAIISLIAGALGFTGVAAGSAGIAKILFGLFLLVAIVFVVLAALGVGAVRKAID